MLVQPIVWLLLYGQLFKCVVELPGFNATSYISFVSPGVVIMSALFSGGWNGMGILYEIDLGIMIGIGVLLLSAVLLAVPFGALSCALALTLRRRESVLAASNFILLPLTFLSPVFMAKGLVPDWIRLVSRFNPVNWSVEAAREALGAHPSWLSVLMRVGWLVALTAVSSWLATRAFRAYQRTA